MRALRVLAFVVASFPVAAFAQTTDPNAPPVTPPPAPPGQVPPGQAPVTTGTSGVDAWGGMNAGGVSPPAPIGGTTATASVSATASTSASPVDIDDELDESKDEDSGRGLSWFWLEVQGGFEHVGLQTFNIEEENFSVGLVETESSGGVVSAGIGAQIIFVTIGARTRLGFFDDWQLGTVGGEVGFHIPIGFVEPRFDFGAGYAAIANFDNIVPEDISIHGFYVRAGAGVDFYPVKQLALGAQATFDFMGLTRPGLDPSQIQAIQQDPDVGDIPAAREQALALDGSGYGAAVAIQGTIGLHL
ncbi:MAG: hypothetical protein HOW73_51380 [Polyangiaceae bacterium]|nr:hypothetical protein [Polyangiaceae bacterium]